MSYKDNLRKIFTMNDGSQCIFIDYRNTKDCDVQFIDEYNTIIKHVSYTNIERGSIKNPYSKSVAGIGCLGIGYKRSDRPKAYSLWCDMINRCYKPNLDRARDLNYKDCFVCNEWHNFQNFIKWYDDNILLYNNNEPMCIDKDIIKKGNKIYCPEFCSLVPQRVNIFLTTTKAKRGAFPIGVTFDKDCNKYAAQCCDPFNRYNRRIGRYNTPEEAFIIYKHTKENYAHELADYYKGTINKKVINALNNFHVDIND